MKDAIYQVTRFLGSCITGKLAGARFGTETPAVYINISCKATRYLPIDQAIELVMEGNLSIRDDVEIFWDKSREAGLSEILKSLIEADGDYALDESADLSEQERTLLYEIAIIRTLGTKMYLAIEARDREAIKLLTTDKGMEDIPAFDDESNSWDFLMSECPWNLFVERLMSDTDIVIVWVNGWPRLDPDDKDEEGISS